MANLVLHAASRDVTGKKVKQLRRQGQMPAVLYGHAVSPEQVTIARGEMEKVYRQVGGSSVVTVEIDGKPRNALIYDVQHDPTTGEYLHADFYQVRMDEKIHANIPLVIEGTSPAVRELEGVLITNLTELEVECLPNDLPPEIIVSIDSLATFDDSITVADVKVPAGVTVLSDPETNVAAVAAPRSQEELEELEEVPEAPDAENVELAGDDNGDGGESSEEGESTDS